MTKVLKEKIPETTEAEYWLDYEVFMVKGKLYKILPDCRVIEIKDEESD